MVRLPIVNRMIPVIADEAVDPAFGTGAVKVTPAHDPTDYDMGARHNLRAINVMNDNMTMNEEAGPYQGKIALNAVRIWWPIFRRWAI